MPVPARVSGAAQSTGRSLAFDDGSGLELAGTSFRRQRQWVPFELALPRQGGSLAAADVAIARALALELEERSGRRAGGFSQGTQMVVGSRGKGEPAAGDFGDGKGKGRGSRSRSRNSRGGARRPESESKSGPTRTPPPAPARRAVTPPPGAPGGGGPSQGGTQGIRRSTTGSTGGVGQAECPRVPQAAHLAAWSDQGTQPGAAPSSLDGGARPPLVGLPPPRAPAVSAFAALQGDGRLGPGNKSRPRSRGASVSPSVSGGGQLLVHDGDGTASGSHGRGLLASGNEPVPVPVRAQSKRVRAGTGAGVGGRSRRQSAVAVSRSIRSVLQDAAAASAIGGAAAYSTATAPRFRWELHSASCRDATPHGGGSSSRDRVTST